VHNFNSTVTNSKHEDEGVHYDVEDNVNGVHGGSDSQLDLGTEYHSSRISSIFFLVLVASNLVLMQIKD
jgi:hypothetical protein